MSDYPMLISNKLHSFRNFSEQKYIFFRILLLFIQRFYGNMHSLFILIRPLKGDFYCINEK